MLKDLADESLPLEARLRAAAALKNVSMEAILSTSYDVWLETFFKPCCQALSSVQPQFQPNVAHQLRNTILELLFRLPQNEALKANAGGMFKLCLRVVQADNQDNSLIAIKIIFDLLKVYKGHLEAEAEKFLELVVQLFTSLPEVVKTDLEAYPAAGPAPPFAAHGSVAIVGARSFRVIQELPLPVMFVAQMYPKVGAAYQEQVQLLMLETPKIPGPQMHDLHPSLAPVYAEMRMAQVKSLSFMGHTLRALKQPPSQAVQDSLVTLPGALVHLLRSVPEGSLLTRKELLASTRHLLNTPYRDMLRNKLDVLLDEGLLLGPSPLTAESLRPLACQVLVELVHFARKTINAEQLVHCVNLLASISASGGLPSSVQTMCVRVVLGLTESVFPVAKNPNLPLEVKLKARNLITLVLDCLVSKLKVLRKQASKILVEAKAERAQLERQKQAVSQAKISAETGMLGPSEGLEDSPSNLSVVQMPGEREKEMQEAKNMITIILSSIKPTIYIIVNFNKAHLQSVVVQQAQQQVTPVVLEPPPGMPLGFTEVEIRLMSRLWSYSLFALRLLTLDTDPRSVCEKFVETFSQMDARDFVEVVSCRMADLFDALLEDNDLLHVVAQLLTHTPNMGIQRAFFMLMFEFLVHEKLDELRDTRTKEGIATLKLFKLVLAAFPPLVDLEPVVGPQMVSLLERCLRLVTTQEDPMGYLQLMRYIFKVVTQAGGQLKTLHADLLPLLRPCCTRFMAMLDGPNAATLRPLLVELCLSLPAQPSALIPLLPRLARPLLNALSKGPDELVVLGLRTLEMWVDNYNPEYIEVVIADIIHEFMGALWALLRPGNPLASKTLYILGKLGGHNRRFLKEPTRLKYKDNTECGLRLILSFKPQNSFLTPFDTCMTLAKAALFSEGPLGDAVNDVHYRQHALRFLQVSLATVLNLRSYDNSTYVPPAPSAPPPSAVVPPGLAVDPSTQASSNHGAAALAAAAPAAAAPVAAAAALLPAPLPAAAGGAAATPAGASALPGVPAVTPAAAAAAAPAPAAAGAAPPVPPQTAAAGRDMAGVAAVVKQEAGGAAAGGNKAGASGSRDGKPLPAAEPPNTDLTVDGLLEVLLGKGGAGVPPPSTKLEQGVKTKTQLVAERSVLVTLLAAVIAAAGDERLSPTAAPFSRDICRHFGMLTATNIEPPPPPPAMFRHQHDSLHAAMPQGLRELDFRLFLDATVEVLSDENEARAKAGLTGLSVFLDTLLTLHAARASLHTSGSQPGAAGAAAPAHADQPDAGAAGATAQAHGMSAQASQHTGAVGVQGGGGFGAEGGASPSEPSAQQQQQRGAAQGQQPMEGVEGLDSSGTRKRPGDSAGTGSSRQERLEREHPALLLGLPAIMDDIMGRMLHCCSSEHWRARLSGAAALQMLLAHPQVPAAYLSHWAALITRALLWVVRGLPEHCVMQARQLDASLAQLMGRALQGGRPLVETGPEEAVAEDEGGGGGPAASDAGAAATSAPPEGEVKEEGGQKAGRSAEEEAKKAGTAGTAPLPQCPLPGQAEPVAAGGPEAMQVDKDGQQQHVAKPVSSSAEPHDPSLSVLRLTPWVRDIGTMLLSYIANPASPSRMRKSAVTCLGLLAGYVGTTMPHLAAAYVKKHSKDVTHRRLLPFKNVEYTIGAAEALSFFLRLSPPVLHWSTELSSIVNDALELATMEEEVLCAQLPSSRSITLKSMTCVRVACMHMLCGLIKMEDAHEAQAQGKQVEHARKEAGDTEAGGARADGGRQAVGEGAQPMQVDGPAREARDAAPDAPQSTSAPATAPAAAAVEGGSAGAAAVATPAAVPAAGGTAPVGAPGSASEVSLSGATPAGSSGAQQRGVAAHACELPEELRSKLATMFFNNLTVNNEDIWLAAKEGVASLLLARNSVSKAILHSGLRPLLTSFKAHTQLNLPLLQGMGRLLEMLSQWFSLNLGKRLLEHLSMWATPEGPCPPGASCAWKSGEEAAVAAHLLELFHLLPIEASFLESREEAETVEVLVDGRKEAKKVTKSRLGLVVLTIELEERLANLRLTVPAPRVMTSPYRKPLTRFLNKYAKEAVAYFLDLSRIWNNRYVSRLLDIVRTPTAEPLLQQLQDSEARLVALAAIGCEEAMQAAGVQPPPAPRTEDEQFLRQMVDDFAPYNVLHLLAVMVKLRPAWMATQRKLAATLRARWNSRARAERLKREDVLGRAQLLESKRLAKCLLAYVHHDRSDVAPLFDLVNITLFRSVMSFAFLDDFCKRVLPEQWSAVEQRALLLQFLAAVREQQYPQDHLEKILQMLVTPVVMHTLEHKQQGVLDAAVLDAFFTDLLGLPTSPAAAAAGVDAMELDAVPVPALRVGDTVLLEFLRLAAHVLDHAPELLAAHQAQLLSLGWQMLKRDTAQAASHPAYTMLASFMRHFPISDEVALQVFASMLRNQQADTKKPLLRDAIDTTLAMLHGRETAARQGADAHPPQQPSGSSSSGGAKPLSGLGVKAEAGAQASAEGGPPAAGPDAAAMAGGQASVGIASRGRDNGPAWVRTVKKVLTEESASLGHVAHLWQVILRNASLFYPHRAQFVASIAHSLPRLGLMQGTNPENRKLALDLCMLLIGWEKRTRALHGPPPPPQQHTDQGIKRPREEEQGREEASAAKAIKTEGGGDAGAAAAAAAAGAAPPSAPSLVAGLAGAKGAAQERAAEDAEQWRMTLEQQDHVTNVLVRLALLLLTSPEAAKDEDWALHQQYALSLIAQAALVFPYSNFKVQYLERLLPTHMESAARAVPPLEFGHLRIPNCSPPPAILKAALFIVRSLLEAQTPHLLVSVHSQVLVLVDPCRQTKSWPHVQELCEIVRMVCAWSIPEGQLGAAELAKVRMDVNGVVERHLIQAVQDVGPNNLPNTLHNQPLILSGVCCCLALLETMAPFMPPARMDAYIPLLVRLLSKAGKEMAQAAQMQHQVHAQQQARRAVPLSMGTADGPEYGSLAWIVTACLRLLAPRVLHSNEQRRALLSSMVSILVGMTVRFFDPAIFFEVLKIVERWLVDPYPNQTGQLSLKEAVLLCQRLGMLERMGAIADPGLRATFEAAFVQLVKKLCSSPRLPQELREDTFTKVERMFMMGLRSTNPTTRHEFFDMYNSHVPMSLYDRLHFIIFSHDWEAMSNQFWLKHALDMVFAVLNEDEELLLAFNTAQVPLLLPGIRQNTFSPSLHMQTKQAASQQEPPQPPQTPQQGNAQAGPASTEVAVKQDAGPPQVKQEGVKAEPDSLLPVKAEPLQPQRLSDSMLPPPPPQPIVPGGVQAAAPGPAAAGGTAAAAAAGNGGMGAVQPALPPQQPVRVQLSVPKAEVPEAVMQMVQEHATFLYKCGELKLRDLMGSLRECVHAEPQIAAHLWALMFPIVWGTMEKQQQITLAKPMISLLSKEYHIKQTHLRPNVVQALLDGIAVSQPQPKIPPELIKFLGKAFNAWHGAIPLLEAHVLMFPNDLRCFNALLELYKQIGEEDMLCGLWRRRCNSEVSKSALSLIQTGHLEQAQELLGDTCMVPPDKVSRSEQVMWVEQWISCAKTLSQWDMLEEYARDTHNHELSLDCLWRLQDWAGLRQTLNKAVQLEESPQMLMIKSYMALQESDLNTSESRNSQATIAALLRWWQLPEVGSPGHIQLLQAFQQLVELREDVRIFADLATGSTNLNHSYQDVRDITDLWRLRVPNEWESMQHWQDLLMWRNHIFNTIISAFSPLSESNPQLHQLGYREKAWSVNRLGAVATAHGHTDTCISILNSMYGFAAMEVQEAFVKIREQARAFLERPTELMAGLNILSTTNLDYFRPQHQSEIFRLKGCLLALIKDPKAAHQSFFQSLSLWKQSAEAWFSWGKLCDEQWDKGASTGVPTPELLEYAVHCILQAVKLGHAPARGLLPRLLYLLSFDNNIAISPEAQAQLIAQGTPIGGPWTNVVSQAMERSGALELAPWVWLPWLPQLHMALARTEAPLIKQILLGLALALPQSVYLPLRTFTLNVREAMGRSLNEERARQKQVLTLRTSIQEAQAKMQEAAAAAQQEAGPLPEVLVVHQKAIQQQQVALQQAMSSLRHVEYVRTMEEAAFGCGRQVSEAVREKYPHLCMTLDALAVEVSRSFIPRQEERLLAVVHALLHRCYKTPFAGHHEVPPMMKKEVLGVCNACFQDSSSSGRKHKSTSTLREEFVRDMHPDSANCPNTLEKMMDYLKAFRGRLLSEVEDKMSLALRIEDEAPVLRDLPLVDIEMPGMYMAQVSMGEPPPADGVVLLEGFGASVGIVRRGGGSIRRLAFLCSDGHARHMLVQQNQNNAQQSQEERILQVMRAFNRMLEAHPQSRSRALAWHVPLAVMVSPGTRLVEEDPSFIAYSEAYEVNALRYGREADLPINAFKRRCANHTGDMVQPSPEGALEKRLAAFQDVCERFVSENVFAQYMYKTMPSSSHLWVFKKTLCAHTALAGLMCHLLLLGGRAPQKLLISKDSGRLAHLDLLPVYNERLGTLDSMEAVPFRLTRNLASFFSGFSIEGIFSMAIVNGAQALLHKSTNIQHVLALFFRDDLVAWSGRRGNSKNSTVSGLKNEMIKSLVLKNVGSALSRLREVAPTTAPEAVQQVLMGSESSVIHGVTALIAAATDPRNLCKMEATWHPWF